MVSDKKEMPVTVPGGGAGGGGRPSALPPPPSEPVPRGPRLGCLLAATALAAAALAAGVAWHGPLRTGAERAYEAALAWSGGRPAAPPAAGAAPAEVARQYYTCGMHPWVILPAPGDCPICHMKLVPLDAAKYTGEIAVNPIITQNIGVRIAPVTSGPVTRVVRTVGSVDYNETLVRDIGLKVAGWVEKLYVNYVGQPVEKDQPLLELYSPELYSAQEEYLLAYKAKGTARRLDGGPPSPELAKMEADLLAAARKRLENFDISGEQVRRLEQSGQAAKTMTIRSPFKGLVVAKNVYEGMRLDVGMQPLRIADLSTVWIMVALYEYQLPYVEVGQRAVMTLPYVPGQTFEGRVTYVYPYLNPELRQVKVRLEFPNPDLMLKPGMFAGVELARTLARDRTLVPREAVIDTGARQVALVSLGEGRFEPRQVRVGVEAEGGMLEIIEGLRPGEMVVVSGQFLLDSEARLREALAKMVKGEPAAGQKAGVPAAGASEPAAGQAPPPAAPGGPAPPPPAAAPVHRH
ncbi:MAG: efflux RND transporter periplasmic adaptor subunit [Planctomycetes bacterium]|nr:efflux RND transporter periplasmic adaptor subunit [Planctomycetota bacterium]